MSCQGCARFECECAEIGSTTTTTTTTTGTRLRPRARRRPHSKADTLAALLRLKAATASVPSSSGYSDGIGSLGGIGSAGHESECDISLDMPENSNSNSNTNSNGNANSRTASDASSLSTARAPAVARDTDKGYSRTCGRDKAGEKDAALRAAYVRELLLGSLSL